MTDVMLRSELIAQLANTLPDLPGEQVEQAVQTVLESLSDALASGERIEIRGFGSFSLHIHPPKLARNPKTGERVEVGQRRVPHFKPGKEMRERVDPGRENGEGNDDD